MKNGLPESTPGYETDTPAFGPKLEEVVAILDYIKQTWPDRERDIQQGR